PLTLILHPLENMKKREPHDEDILLAIQNSKRLLRLVNEFLDLQKYSIGNVNLSFSPINLSAFLNACCKNLGTVCENRNIKLIKDIKAGVDIYVMAQLDVLEKIVLNFFSNAIRYSPTGESITISLRQDGEMAVLSVTDKGPGISPENQAKLFKTFFQIEDIGFEGFQGSGLGLALVKNLAHSMNGDTFVESAISKGSTFGIRIPMHIPKNSFKDILIVDDDEDILTLLHKQLNAAGITSDVAPTLSEARRFFSRTEYLCILCDFHMQEEKGTGFLKEVAIRAPATVRLILSGDPNVEEACEIINEAKVEKIYFKPIIFKDLKADILGFKQSGGKGPIKVADLSNYELKIDPSFEFHTCVALEETDDANSGDGKLILVVDDLRDMRRLLTRLLTSKSYRVVSAKDGEEGISKALELKPDLIIVDWMMPVVSGIEMISRMSKNEKLSSIPTILLTAKSDEASKVLGIHKGAHAFLGKPFDEMELFSTVENLINLKSDEEKIKQLNFILTENVLKRFLPRKLVNDICSGKKIFDDIPRLMDVTVLFADLMGFTNMAEELGPHLISEILNSYFDKMTSVIFSHGGTINKFLGDGIMVIFGAPDEMSSADQVKNAIDCAISMHKNLSHLNTIWQRDFRVEFSMRVGIHKGSGIVGMFGGEERMEYTVIGPMVNIASEIEINASPGEIFFSSSIRDSLAGYKWVKAGIFELKGVGETSLYKIIYDDINCEKKDSPKNAKMAV
ncbi:MAG: response regulator, partial [Oligoflexales bacterium]|nr:response regulator [Oligoflexales bacterium]